MSQQGPLTAKEALAVSRAKKKAQEAVQTRSGLWQQIREAMDGGETSVNFSCGPEQLAVILKELSGWGFEYTLDAEEELAEVVWKVLIDWSKGLEHRTGSPFFPGGLWGQLPSEEERMWQLVHKTLQDGQSFMMRSTDRDYLERLIRVAVDHGHNGVVDRVSSYPFPGEIWTVTIDPKGRREGA